MKKVITIIFEIIVILIVLWFVLGYLNFGKITDGEEPIYIVKEKTYEENGASIYVYDNILYKIVRYEKDKITYSIKLWFMRDY